MPERLPDSPASTAAGRPRRQTPAQLRRKLASLPEALREVTGRMHSIETCGTVDGPGIRTVVFLQGCLLRCQFCHNPDTWTLRAGQQVTVASLLELILPYQRFHAASQGGLTLSGGDPLAQPLFSAALLQACNQIGVHTALDTAGGVPLERSRPVLDAADLVLLDIKHSDPEQHHWLTGVALERPLATGDYLASIGKPVWIRHVLIPGITDRPEQLDAVAAIVGRWPNIARLDVLGFHTAAMHKWQALNKTFPLADTPPATPEQVAAAKDRLRQHGLPVPM